MAKLLSFEAYKQKGKLEYVEVNVAKDEPNTMSNADFVKEIDDIAEVMEMSTDELVGELSLRVQDQTGLRKVEEEKLIEELTQRLFAIEYVLAMAISRYEK